MKYHMKKNKNVVWDLDSKTPTIKRYVCDEKNTTNCKFCHFYLNAFECTQHKSQHVYRVTLYKKNIHSDMDGSSSDGTLLEI